MNAKNDKGAKMRTILHITKRESWNQAQKTGEYTAPSLDKQGFIHCSTEEQVVPVANCIFRGQRGLVLLCIDEARLTASVKYENLEGGQRLFPHVYGTVNLDAVIKVVEFPPLADGTFALPPGLAEAGAG
jgi:uncharacterized protein (DUF952 family)